MNWTNLEFTDYKINKKSGKKYYQRYLKPCYYLEIYLRWTSNDEILKFHHSVMEETGQLFTYHHNSNKSRESKFRDREKAINTMPDFLASKKSYIWHELSNNGGIGNVKEIGGVSNARLSYWIHKTPFSEKKRVQQVENYKKLLTEFNTSMLPQGIKISKVVVCFPINHFNQVKDFFNWIINNEFIKKGTFFSGSAGYMVNYWEGYVNKQAKGKLNQMLSDFPGLGFEIMGNHMGRVLNKDKSDILPIIRRLNWLTFISKEGVKELGNIDKLKMEIEKNKISKVYPLKNGICIKACKEPALSEKDENFNQYYNIQKVIHELRFRKHPRDRKDYSSWLYKFEDKAVTNNE